MKRIHTFSIKPNDTDNNKLLSDIYLYCDKTGVKFSSIVLSALNIWSDRLPKNLDSFTLTPENVNDIR